MAENTYINKVVLGNDTLLDLTEDSVTANTLLEGETAHKASGEPITGTAKQGHIIWNAIKTALSPQRLKLWFADAKVTDDSTEQATKVEVVQLIDDESELTNAPDGVYQGDYDDAPEDILDASMVAYEDGSVKDALDNLVGTKTVKSSTTPTYNAQIASEFASGSGDNLTLYTLSNGMRVMNGLFLVTATEAASTDKLFDIPSEYLWNHEGYSNQYWFTATNVLTKESYTIRIYESAFPWGVNMPSGTYLLHEVF